MPELSEQELAARYGWALSVLNSDPSLRSVFNRAVAETWAPDRFIAELRNTDWFKTHGEAARQAAVLKNSDPATWRQRRSNLQAEIHQVGRELGAVWNPAIIGQITDNALTFGWNQQQIRDTVANYVKLSQRGYMYGRAQQTVNDLREYAASMGVRISGKQVEDWAAAVAGGSDITQFKASIQGQAESAFPHLRDRIQSGETVAQIAEPYKQSMAQILEMNPEALDVWDPTIRSALAGQTQDGKPALKTVWQFENDLRKDPRWRKTNNAREQAMGTARQVLTDFGLAV